MSQNEMRNLMALRRVRVGLQLTLVCLLSISAPASPSPKVSRQPAAIHRAVSAIATPSEIFYGHDGDAISPDLIATFNKIKTEEERVDLSKFIPTDISPTNNSQQVAIRVADRTMETLFNSVEFRQSPLGSATLTVQESLNTELRFQSVPNKSQVVEHKLQMSLQAFQSFAQIRYTGFADATVRYFLNSPKVAFELSERIAENKSIILSHAEATSDRFSKVAFQIEF
jgi:hypothetical protein